MTFKTWIKQFHGEDSTLGDLAEDIQRDNNFPSTNRLEKMLSHLIAQNACSDCIREFSGAYIEYMTGEVNRLTEKYIGEAVNW